MRVVVALGAEDLTTRQIHEKMPDVPQASLYRAVSQLDAAGMIEVVKSERRGGAMERTYRMALDNRPLSDEDISSTSTEEVLGVVQTLADMVVTSSGRYLADAGASWSSSRLTVRHYPMWLTDDERAELSKDLLDLLDSYSAKKRTDDSSLYTVNVAVVPEVEGDLPSDGASNDGEPAAGVATGI